MAGGEGEMRIMPVVTSNSSGWDTLKSGNIFYRVGLLYSVFLLLTQANILIGFILTPFSVHLTEWYSVAGTQKTFHALLSGEINFVLIPNLETFLSAMGLDWLQFYENKWLWVHLTC